jgi:predicted alternative tryptophan synthase beta-subunit
MITKKINLDEREMPRAWYNIVPDRPGTISFPTCRVRLHLHLTPEPVNPSVPRISHLFFPWV